MEKQKNSTRLLFLAGETELTPKEKRGLRSRSLKMGCEILIRHNFIGAIKVSDSTPIVLIITLNYVPKVSMRQYFWSAPPILYVFSDNKGTAKKVKETERDGFNNFLLIVEKINPELIFEKILDIRRQKQNQLQLT